MAEAIGYVEDRKGEDDEVRRFLLGIGRGAAGAMLFGIPMLMTMELWELGFYIERTRLLLLMVAAIPLLIMLAHLIGFERTTTWRQAIRDATIAYGLGIAISAAVLSMLGAIELQMPASAILGTIALQAVPASIGAMLGRSQLGGQAAREDDDSGEGEGSSDDDPVPDTIATHYGHELFLMAVGALFLNLNVAPTEEVILISYKMTHWHALAAIIVSIAIMHAFVYAVAFKGTHEIPGDIARWHVFVRFTLPGYIIAMLISLYVLWTFGRLDDVGPTQVLMSVIVLSFPGAIGAASARLVL